MSKTISIDLSQDGDAVLEEYRRRTFGPYEIRMRIAGGTEQIRRLGAALEETSRILCVAGYAAEEGAR